MKKNIKKILIIMVMLIGVNTYAVTTINNGSGGFNTTGGVSSGPTGGVSSGVTGGVSSGATGGVSSGPTGFDKPTLGSGQEISPNSELYKTPNYNSGGGVPKLSLEGIVYWLVGILNQLVYVIIGAALVMFLYGILKLSFVDGQKPEAREQARKFMFWGIVSLFVMVSVWGLVRIFQFTLFGNGNLILPSFK